MHETRKKCGLFNVCVSRSVNGNPLRREERAVQRGAWKVREKWHGLEEDERELCTASDRSKCSNNPTQFPTLYEALWSRKIENSSEKHAKWIHSELTGHNSPAARIRRTTVHAHRRRDLTVSVESIERKCRVVQGVRQALSLRHQQKRIDAVGRAPALGACSFLSSQERERV